MIEEKIRVAVTGATGRMGLEVIKTVIRQPDMQLVGAIDVRHAGAGVGELTGCSDTDITVEEDLLAIIAREKPDVLVDFTNPEAALKNARTALSNGIAVVIGTSGLDEVDVEDLQKAADRSGLGVLVAPNFALGAVLMMVFARQAARYFKHVEIIEQHHDQKVDAPSGTALKTAHMISEERTAFRQGNPNEYEKIKCARGGEYEGIRIHSVRLPGLIAHQEVIFGGLGQILTIRHDSFNRESFMPGVVLAVRKVKDIKGVVIGLENII